MPKIKETLFLGLTEGPAQGPELAMQVVSHFTGLLVNAYIATDFQGFIDAVDAVGCVNIDIPARIYDPLHSKADFEPGVHCLSGPWVLAFIRVRQNTANSYRTTDFQRMDAESQVLCALKGKLLKCRRRCTFRRWSPPGARTWRRTSRTASFCRSA